MKHEEQLNDFFEHALSPAEEQNFLISVAACDELRIAFRSQLELMKAVRSDKDSLRIGASGPVAQVRNRTLAALGLSATAATPFIEQELMRSGKGEQAIAATQSASLAGPIVGDGGMQWIGHLLHTPIAAITAGLLLGVLSTTAVEHFTTSSAVPAANPSGIHARMLEPSMNVPIRPRTIETIPAKNGLHNMDERSAKAEQSSSHVAAVKDHTLRMAAHHADRISASNSINGTPAAAALKIPEMTRNNPGMMQPHKVAINQTNDTAKATK